MLPKFVDHIITKTGKKDLNFGEPSTDMKEMRKLVTQLVKPPHHQNARKQVNIRDLMPSVPKDSAEPYKKLYENTKAWTNNIKTKINALDDARKKEEANALMDAAKIAVGEMAAMRTAGYKNAKYEAFSAEFRGKATATTDGEEGEKYRVELYVKDIKPENNGGVSKYKEVDREELDKKGTGAALEMIKWMDEWDAKDVDTAHYYLHPSYIKFNAPTLPGPK